MSENNWKDEEREAFKKFVENEIAPDVVARKLPYLAITDKEADYWLDRMEKLEASTEKRVREEILQNNYCCKFQTIKPEDFCDYCIGITTNSCIKKDD